MNEVSEILVGALQDVEKAEVPDDLREIAFKEAIRLRESEAEQAANGGEGASGGGDSEGGPVGQIASRFGVENGQAEDIFDVRDGEVQLVVGSRALSAGKATATKEIALLIVGALQASDDEDWTSVDAIREWCKHYGKYDPANFGKTIASMEDLFRFMNTGQKREVKMRQPAWEEAGDVVRRLLGGE